MSERFLSIKQVIACTSLSKTEIYRQIRENRFPSSFPISKQKVAWREADVTNWQYDRLREAGHEIKQLDSLFA